MWIKIEPIYKACYNRLAVETTAKEIVRDTFLERVMQETKFDWKIFKRRKLTRKEAIHKIAYTDYGYLLEHKLSTHNNRIEYINNIINRAVEASGILEDGTMYLSEEEKEFLKPYIRSES